MPTISSQNEWASQGPLPLEREASGYGPPGKDGSTPHREGPSAAWRPRTGWRLTGGLRSDRAAQQALPCWQASSLGRGNRTGGVSLLPRVPTRPRNPAAEDAVPGWGWPSAGPTSMAQGIGLCPLGGKGGLFETWKCLNHLELAQVKWPITSRNWSLWTKLYSDKYY